MNKFKEAIDKVFNWKKNPASVFFLALPLFFLGMAGMFLQAYLHYKLDGSIGYFVIVAIAVIALPLLLYPAFKIHQSTVALQSLSSKKSNKN